MRFLFLFSLLFTASAAAQQYQPTKPVRVFVGYAAGSSTDIVGRIVARHLTDKLGQPVVVENKAGAGGTIGADLVASGSFASVGGSEGRIRVDVRLQDAATGETLTTFAETGSEASLFDLVTHAGAKLRSSVGASEPSSSDAK